MTFIYGQFHKLSITKFNLTITVTFDLNLPGASELSQTRGTEGTDQGPRITHRLVLLWLKLIASFEGWRMIWNVNIHVFVASKQFSTSIVNVFSTERVNVACTLHASTFIYYALPSHFQSFSMGVKWWANAYHWINSLLPSDAIWCLGSLSTLDHIMACCLIALSHYLKQCSP